MNSIDLLDRLDRGAPGRSESGGLRSNPTLALLE